MFCNCCGKFIEGKYIEPEYNGNKKTLVRLQDVSEIVLCTDCINNINKSNDNFIKWFEALTIAEQNIYFENALKNAKMFCDYNKKDNNERSKNDNRKEI